MKRLTIHLTYFTIFFIISSCSRALQWPDSPLYVFDQTDSITPQIIDIDSAKKAIVGHYAHYDVVAYEDTTTQTPMLSFIITYGFTDFYLDGDKLMQTNRFVHAEQKINQSGIVSSFNDAAVQAIKPRIQEVELTFKNGFWHIYRPSTPVLLGITGDASQPLSKDKNDPNLIDPDNDGHPGVTVKISISNVIKGEIYITRREIYSYYLTLNPNRTLSGYVEDKSEQFVVGASLKILNQPSNSIQNPDMGLSPVLLVPISNNINTPEELMEIRNELFPVEPEFID